MLRRLEPAEIDERRVEIDELDDAGRALAIALSAGHMNDQRRPGRGFEERALVPPAAAAKMEAVVADEDDDCVLRQAEALEGFQQSADLGVHEGDAGIVGAHELLL